MLIVGGAGVKAWNFVHKTHLNDLIPTHSLTSSRNKFRKLTNDIYDNGVNTPINYVKYNGNKYIVDGHHRVQAAKNLGMESIPSIRVDLPYKGYKSIQDLEFNY